MVARIASLIPISILPSDRWAYAMDTEAGSHLEPGTVISRSADIVTDSREILPEHRLLGSAVGGSRVDAAAGAAAKVPKFACKA